MRSNNVIPFPKRTPSQGELEVYRRITRNWSPTSRRIIFPDFQRSLPQTAGELPGSSAGPRQSR